MKQILPIYLLIFIFGLSLFAQPSYQITHYTREMYGGGSQNWSIDMDANGFLYSANNNGLMKYDGVNWRIFKSPSQNILRSVMIDKEKIYTGSFEEFGFWSADSKNNQKYTSLVSSLQNNNLHNTEIWKIISFKGKIYFQGFSSLYVYDGNKLSAIKIPPVVVFLLKTGDRLFLQESRGKLYELVNDKLILINQSESLIGTEVKTILEIQPGRFLIGTTSHGLFMYEHGTVKAWQNPANELLKECQINNGILFRDLIAFGTIVKGIIIIDKQGHVIHQINNSNSLQNNTVLSLYNNKNLGIWTGLDNGIDYISFTNQVQIYSGQNEALGAVYSAALYDNILYIGTNRGIFSYKAINEDYYYEGFLKNSQGQVWQIKEIDGTLFIGHTNGTYILENKNLRMISNVNGGYMIQKFIHNNIEYLIQSTYSALVIYRKENNNWVYSHQLEGFNEPARYIEVDHQGNIWIAHAIKGLYRLQLDNDLRKITEINNYGEKDGLNQNKGIKIFKIRNRIIFSSGSELFTWDDLKNKIVHYQEFENDLGKSKTFTSVSQSSNNDYWLLNNVQIELYKFNSEKPEFRQRIVLAQYNMNMVEGYENVIPIANGQHVICLDNGFGIFSEKDDSLMEEPKLEIVFREIVANNSNGEQFSIDPGSKKIRLKYSRNNINITFSTLQNPCNGRLYQYRLQGIDTGWNNWTNSGQASYSRLPSGKYKFMVRTLTSNGTLTKPIITEIIVLRPVLASRIAIAFYIILFILLISLLLRYNKKRIYRHHLSFLNQQDEKTRIEKQMDEQQIILLKNENLKTEITHKTIQLADATMAMMKKNEVLIEIKTELEKQKEDLGPRYPARYLQKVTTLIEKSISNDKDWEIFEALFDQAHEDFFKRLKQVFTDLTQSDLKLCAYLKLNLSSKEIAPLLNISIRGVEIRRYRLRKRLGLKSDENLVEFIMQF